MCFANPAHLPARRCDEQPRLISLRPASNHLNRQLEKVADFFCGVIECASQIPRTCRLVAAMSTPAHLAPPCLEPHELELEKVAVFYLWRCQVSIKKTGMLFAELIQNRLNREVFINKRPVNSIS